MKLLSDPDTVPASFNVSFFYYFLTTILIRSIQTFFLCLFCFKTASLLTVCLINRTGGIVKLLINDLTSVNGFSPSLIKLLFVNNLDF